jgi:hypothetical protein
MLGRVPPPTVSRTELFGLEVVRQDHAEVRGPHAALGVGERWVASTLTVAAPTLGTLRATIRVGRYRLRLGRQDLSLGDPELDAATVVTCSAPAVLRGLLDEPARAALRALLLGREAPGLPWRLELGGGEVRASSPPHPVGPSHPRRRVVLDPTGARVPPLREASRAVATIAAMPRRLGERWRVLAQRLRQPSPSGDFVPGGFALELRVGPERGRVEFLVQAGAPVTRVWIGAAPGTTLPPRHPRDVARAGAVVAVRRRDHWEVELPGWQPDLEQVRAAVAALRVAQLAEPPRAGAPYR